MVLALLLMAAPVDFSRDVYPLLEKRCHACHGAKRQPGRVRLDSKDSATRVASLLVEKVASGQMPPTPDKLSATDVALLREWSKQQRHWAYIKPVKADGSIDRFLPPKSGEAPRETLLRRVSLDLAGLPPTIAELDAFLSDSAPNAFEKQVDRLLASRHFGERWAQWWLDLARYADTNGYESDEPRSNWPWRDWVIRAFNRNLPFDQFTIEQIAGDLLPNRTEDQLIATGFHRNTLINSEAGSKDDEFRDAAVKDRVETTATVWLGSTIGCAQCHDHKYDPFSQRDFYRFYAFFNNTAESSIQLSEEHRVFHGDRARLDRLRATWEPLQKVLDTPTEALEAAQVGWESMLRRRAPGVTASWRELASSMEQTFEAKPSGPFTALRFDDAVGADLEAWTQADLDAEKRHETQKPTWGDWHQAGPFEAESPELAHGTAWPPERAVTLDAQWRVRKDLPDGAPYQLDGYNCSVYLYRTVTAAAAQRVRVAVASAQGIKVFLNGKQVFGTGALEPVEGEKGELTLDLRAGVNQLLLKYTNGPGYYRYYFKSHVGPRATLKPVATSPDKKTLLFASPVTVAMLRVKLKQKQKSPVRVSATAWPVAELRDHAMLAADASREEVARYYRWNSPALAGTRREYDRRKAAHDEFFEKNSANTLVMREMSPARESFIQQRGNFLTKLEPVKPGVPAILPQLPDGSNRLDLARWLVSKDNPLTGRVLANHFWRAIFGQGIVKTGEDFGSQGDRPVHPELLDWLAVDFADRAWDTKAFLKQMVMSRHYRQARGPRFRLSAELIRDVTLASSGLLSPKVGGPSVFPPLPASVFENLFIETGFQAWPTSKGEDRYRRGMYTFYKRTAPYPMFQTFDAPERAVCAVDRPRSNTPLQALTMLNDEVFVEAARALSKRMAGASPRDKVVHGFRLTTSRRPGDAELAPLMSLLDKSMTRYRADQAAARKLSPGAPELAPWVVVANVLLNLDEAVTKE